MREAHASSIARLCSALSVRQGETKSKENVATLHFDRPWPDTVRMHAALRLRTQPSPPLKCTKEADLHKKAFNINRMAVALACRKLPTESPHVSRPHIIESDFAIARLSQALRLRCLPNTEKIGAQKIALKIKL